jgi:hypothetical protein
MAQVIRPAIAQMRSEGMPFTGFLYAGLMMTAQGPKVVEFNARLGDPETQALMHRMASDFVEPLFAAAHGALDETPLDWKADPSVCVVLAAAGYPGIGANGRCDHGAGSSSRGDGVSRWNKTRQKCFGHLGRPRFGRDRERSDSRPGDSQHIYETCARSISTACTIARTSGKKVSSAGKIGHEQTAFCGLPSSGLAGSRAAG